MATPRVWLITGASRGLGWSFVDAVLESGDIVAATARQPDVLRPFADRFGDRFAAFQLDVNNKSEVDATVAAVVETFGRIDVAVNNAGFGLRGAIEEVTEEQARAQIETNLFGALWVTQAVIPPMRAQGSGHIVQISSMGGQVAFPLLGLYHASKWGLEGFTESLAPEMAPFGIKVTIVEPGGFRTDWNGSSMTFADVKSGYEGYPGRDGVRRQSPGDPAKAGAALLKVVDDPNPPLRAVMGVMALDMVQEAYHRRLAESDRGKAIARSTEWTD